MQNKYANKNKPNILLLRYEEYGFLEKILGDANTEILNNAKVPVWIIPEESSLSIPGKIAYITDHRQGDIDALKKLVLLSEIFNASIHFVHVMDKDVFESRIKKEGFINIVNEEFVDNNFNHLEIKRNKMTRAVQDLIREKDINLLTMRNESENFLNRYFTRSSVEKIIDSVKISLVIY
ncbi:MAG: hypothetical protein ABFS05_08865 [Bacteroidota bacterium]